MDTFNQFHSRYNFTIARCGKSLVGNKSLHPEVKHPWRMTLNKKFHDWDCDRFWVVTKGKGHVVSTFGEFDVTEDHAYYIPASTIISTSCDDLMEQYFVNFVTIENNSVSNSLYIFDYQTARFDLSLNLAKNIILESEKEDAYSSIFLNSAISLFLSLFLKDITDNIPLQLKSALQYIDKHLNEKISISALAQISGYTLEYFSALFKSSLQFSPQQYITNKRIALAKHYLLTTSMSIGEVALACGFTDALYFSRIFSKKTLSSPSSFRDIKNDPK